LNISPLDVRNQVFKKGLRGYDADEVRMFLDAVADCMEDMLKEKENLERETEVLREKAKTFSEIESALRETMVTAQRICDEAKVNAEREAGNLIKEADLEAKRRVSDAQRQIEELGRARDSARSETMAFVAKLRSLLEAQLSFLGSIESEIRQGDSPEGKAVEVCEDAAT
jgi:cell division initiation protein